MARFHDLAKTGKNCYYRLMERTSMDWRRPLIAMNCRFHVILRKEGIAEATGPTCFILDDTTIMKTGIHMEGISRVFDQVKELSLPSTNGPGHIIAENTSAATSASEANSAMWLSAYSSSVTGESKSGTCLSPPIFH